MTFIPHSKDKNVQRNKKRSLSRELLLWLSMVVSLILLLASLGNYVYLFKQAEEIYGQRAGQYLAYLSEAFELPLWSVDDALVQKIARSFANNKDIGLLRVQDDRSRIIYEKVAAPDEYELIKAQNEIVHDNIKVGNLELGITPYFYQRMQQQLLMVSIATLLLMIICLFLAVRLLFQRLLETPLSALIRHTKAVAAGKYQLKIEDLRYREFDTISDSISFMADQVLNREQSLRENNQCLQNEIEERLKAEADLKAYQDNLEELISQRTDELKKAYDELAIAKDLAEAANYAKSDFLASMSHEIRTPMNAVLGMLYLALKNEMTPTLHNYLTKAHNSAQLLLGIINDTLDFSKIESGRMEIEAIEFRLETVLEELIDTIGFQADKKGIQFLVRPNIDIPPQLIGDPLRLRQVFLNLCSNAVKFTETGEVELSFDILDKTDSELILQTTVRDTGIGMSDEVQKGLFQKFTQADQTTTRRFGGTGLGLAISKHLVELMGGQIWLADSRPGKGTTIICTMLFKIAEPKQVQHSALLQQAVALVAGTRVLVVDDNEMSCEILTKMLRAFQIDASIANSGMEAIEQIKQAVLPFQLVLMDWRMPGLSGDEVVRNIRLDPAILHKPKIVMVTAYGRDDVMNLANQVGMDGFLVKPVSPSTLLDTILSVLGRGHALPASQPSEQLPIPSILGYTGARLLLVEDNEINREFAVELLRSMKVEVDEVVNGEQAVQRVQKQVYDGVLMDVQMPVMDGLEATRRIRALAQQAGGEYFASLPIIAMTAMATIEDVEKCRQAGMNDYISKPIWPERLSVILEQWIQVDQNNPQNVLPKSEATPDDFLALTSIDVKEGIRRIGGNIDVYRKQLFRFRDHYVNAVQELQRLITEQNLVSAEFYCHEIKGVSGNLGAKSLFVAVTDVDNTLKNNQIPTNEQLEVMQELLQQCITEINTLNTIVASVSTTKLRGDELLAKLAALKLLLEHDLGACALLLDDLCAGVMGTDIETVVLEIADKIDVFEIDEAQLDIKTLIEQLSKQK